jgi:UDP-glucose 4-epimerase
VTKVAGMQGQKFSFGIIVESQFSFSMHCSQERLKSEMHILICGGAGYIGSHMVKMVEREGHHVTTFDNLSTGHRWAVKWGRFVEGDLLDTSALGRLFSDNHFDVVMHFSARSLVGESVQKPLLYYRNNVTGTLNLLECMRKAKVNRFIFSSTAAIFGDPIREKIDENHPQKPINPYGHGKLMVEQILRDFASGSGLSSVSLRYFNAAGADPEGEIGEAHNPETHLIPNVIKAALGIGGELKIFGNDYETPDGTCVRDYIHVNDLCRAHLLALEYLESHSGAHGFNLGNGHGFSVWEIIKATEKVVGRKIPCSIIDRRAGDPDRLVADSTLAKNELKWQSRYDKLEDIIYSAWRWHELAVMS